MPARTIQASPDEWQRVAEYAYRRRARLNLTAADVVDRAGGEISLKIVSMIENARQTSYLDKKLRSLSRALWGTDDAIDLILRGEEPVKASPEPADVEPGDLAGRVADLERRLSKWEPVVELLDAERRAAEADARYRAKLSQLAERSESPQPAEEVSPRQERRGA